MRNIHSTPLTALGLIIANAGDDGSGQGGTASLKGIKFLTNIVQAAITGGAIVSASA